MNSLLSLDKTCLISGGCNCICGPVAEKFCTSFNYEIGAPISDGYSNGWDIKKTGTMYWPEPCAKSLGEMTEANCVKMCDSKYWKIKACV